MDPFMPTASFDYSSDPQHDHDAESYDMHHMARADSRTRLEPAPDSYSLPPGAAGAAAAAAGTAPQPAAFQVLPSRPLQHAAYPPTAAPISSTPPPPRPVNPNAHPSGFTTVPLNDMNPLRSGANSPSQGHGSTTSRSRNPSKLGFLPLGAGSSSTLDHSPEDPEKRAGRAGAHGNGRRSASWDRLGTPDAERAEWENFNPANSKVQRLRFAEGDAGKTKLSRLYLWLLNRGIVIRWSMFIIPILALLWIPGIVGLTMDSDPTVWGVPLLWWSIWLTVMWLGFWASKAAFMIFPHVFRQTIAVIIPNLKQYTDMVRNLGKYAKFILWTFICYITWQPLIERQCEHPNGSNSANALSNIEKILLGIVLCTVVTGIEKLLVQLIAFQFHRDSYADRLDEQKFQIKILTTLYSYSHDIPGRSDTLADSASTTTKGTRTPKIAIRKALRGIKSAAQSTTNAFGNVASEMTGSSVLQTNSPSNKVKAAISSSNKSKALARRLYYSFRQPGTDHLTIADIARFFPDLETAERAFNLFDRDGNGDATRDEIDAAVLDVHRERMSLEASMRDVDGAVSRLNDILMFLVLALCALIMSAMITSRIATSTFIASTGTFILSLSWMIGTTMQEILLSCIFLFVKHPYDVGDRVDIDGNSYTVAKMELMSTSFKRVDGKFVWIGHNVLALKVIENVRRSGPTSETFVFDVAFDTTFEKLQALRAKMLKFCKDNSRDFLPIFDVSVDDIPQQGKMVLKADIRYKSNWQQGALKVQRRNKWVCQLKICLAELKIWGPADAGDPSPPPPDAIRYTQVPWEDVLAAEQENATPTSPPPTFHAATGGNLVHRRNDSSLDIWGEHTYDHDESVPPSRMPSPGPDRGFQLGTPTRRPHHDLPHGTHPPTSYPGARV
ncbi:Mechanosensitive ion channel protein Msy1 [Vanrija pseudolonga]|uniref:Mechanosensitive ion channel protein Msy1 n=1 Tax=Vanrija pseudolonga TaxID=143232 RepID=A0AAF0YGN7_9TREE|nr:Mechanosensitive ion channel protein Msy1 [Vanrija pseudolonga]